MITVGILAKIRRLHLRDKLSIREIAKRTNLSRNTIRHWLRQPEMTEPKYPDRQNKSVVDPYIEQLRQWIVSDSHRPKRDRRTAIAMFEALKVQGYTGSYTRVAIQARKLRQESSDAPSAKPLFRFPLPTAQRFNSTGAASMSLSVGYGGAWKWPTAS